MSCCLAETSPMNLRDLAPPGETVDTVMMVSVRIQAFTHRDVRTQSGYHWPEVPQPTWRRGPLPGLICVPSSSFLTPCPDARAQRQLLEMARPDPHAVQEGAGVEARGGTLS